LILHNREKNRTIAGFCPGPRGKRPFSSIASEKILAQGESENNRTITGR
jgi:hypothetical protein